MSSRNVLLIAAVAAVLSAIAGGVLLVRRNRTVHPPVASTVPRIEDYRGVDGDNAAGSRATDPR